MKKRIDLLLVEQGYFESRERAKSNNGWIGFC